MNLRTFIVFLSISTSVFAMKNKSICDGVDEREVSYDSRIARLRHSLDDVDDSCSATLIGKNCMITAGHCYSRINFIEFNTPKSKLNGELMQSKDKDIFLADKSSVKTGRSYYPGEDWAVFKLIPKDDVNLESTRGSYPVSFEPQEVGVRLTITGYGSDEGEFNRTQQIATGEIVRLEDRVLSYRIDTENGNSGSSVINFKGEVVAIHTLGGCSSSLNSRNRGTRIYDNEPLIEAIKSCLR